MCDPIQARHLMNLTETDVESLTRLCGSRPHPTPREFRLAQALRDLERGQRRRLKSKVRNGTR